MIEFTETHVNVSVNVVKALLQFASKDQSRPSIYGIGINQGNLCATDGVAAIRFQKHTGTLPDDLDGRVFPREYVESKLALTIKAKSLAVHLRWDQLLSLTFPPLDRVEVTNRRVKLPANSPFGVDAYNLARLVSVQRACSPGKRPVPHSKGYQFARLVSRDGNLEPCSFEVGSHSTGHPSIHFARVTIMPVRIDW